MLKRTDDTGSLRGPRKTKSGNGNASPATGIDTKIDLGELTTALSRVTDDLTKRHLQDCKDQIAIILDPRAMRDRGGAAGAAGGRGGGGGAR